MSLVPVSNQEIGIKVEALEEDLKIINQLSDDAHLVDDELLKN